MAQQKHKKILRTLFLKLIVFSKLMALLFFFPILWIIRGMKLVLAINNDILKIKSLLID
jgi:hypothetical protein